MLFLLFQLGNDRYALESRHVVEIVPLLALKKIPGAPRGVAGLFNYRGVPVPAVDLCELALKRPAAERLSTRIIVIQCRDVGGRDRLLGLIAERATDMLRKEAADFANPHLQISAAPYLGPVLMDDRGPIQWIQEQHLLPPQMRDSLFTELTEAYDAVI